MIGIGNPASPRNFTIQPSNPIKDCKFKSRNYYMRLKATWKQLTLLLFGLLITQTNSEAQNETPDACLSKLRSSGILDELGLQKSLLGLSDKLVSLQKGGIGIIAPDFYVETQNQTNRIIIGNKSWTGKAGSEKQLVYSDGKKIITRNELKSARSIIVILFTPDAIRFFNERKKTGGIYLR
jgi:hypothetical protein